MTHAVTARIRLATAAHVAPMLAIYAPIVEHTAISFEFEVPTEEQLAQRIARTLEHRPWLVCEERDALLGYAYATPFRARPAYAWTVETSVYVHADHRRRGVARGLYTALLDTLRAQGFQRAIAGIALPNDPSVALHESLGFTPVGVFQAVGGKGGAWHAVGFWDLELQPLPGDAPEPLPLAGLTDEGLAVAFAAGEVLLRPAPPAGG